MTEFSLSELYKNVFGYVAPPFPLGEISYNSGLGTITALLDSTKQNKFGGIHISPLELDGFKFPLEPMVSVTGSNKIIRRHVAKAESGGSIKERFSDDDFKIDIKGVLIGENSFPEQEMSQLISLCRKKSHIEAKSPMLSVYGITNIVIDSFEFPHTQGKQIQAFKLSAYSDELFDALLEDS